MSKKPKVSVLVLNWNGKRFIDQFMKSYLQQDYPKDALELLFIDNNSSDDSLAYTEREYANKYPNIKLVKNDKNYGYAGGNNRGVHQATGQFILVVNNDLEMHKSMITEMVSTAIENDAAAINPKILFKNNPGYINNAGSRLDINSAWPIYEIGANEKDDGKYDKVCEISAICGASVLFTREFLSTVGMFDARFFMYFEDGDLSWRGRKKGFSFYYAPQAIAYHEHTGSSKEGSPLFNHFVGRNRILILTKNGEFIPWAKAWKHTLADHLLLRIKNIYLSLGAHYGKKQALKEFLLSQKMIWAAVCLTPYALAKRCGILKEEKL